MLDGFLRDIGQHRVSAAERHHGHFAEEDCDFAKYVGGSQAGNDSRYRDQPERQPYSCDGQRSPYRRPYMFRDLITKKAVDDPAFLFAAMSALDLECSNSRRRA